MAGACLPQALRAQTALFVLVKRKIYKPGLAVCMHHLVPRLEGWLETRREDEKNEPWRTGPGVTSQDSRVGLRGGEITSRKLQSDFSGFP